MNIGERIKLIREQKGLTLEELGKLCKTTKQTVYKYENSIVTNIPLDRLALIADALGVSSAYLMGWENTPGENEELKKQVDEVTAFLSQVEPEQREAVLQMLRAFVDKK